MLILGIESSCDETGIALYDCQRGLLAHALHSQVEMHAEYGGVVPELASRDHIKRVLPLLTHTLKQCNKSLSDIDAIAYTEGPGLSGALLVGSSIANALAFSLNIPVIPVHHLEGHLLAPLLEVNAPNFPFVALLVSGGHTQLIYVQSIGQYRLLGDTLDDAAGEAFDKTAKLLDLGYPGGPALAKLAEQGQANQCKLPRPMLHSGDLNFSFSGLKTAVLTLIQNQQSPLNHQTRANIAYEFQEAVTDILAQKCLLALKQTNMSQLIVSGGVGANLRLREKLTSFAKQAGVQVHYPRIEFCTDNGAMIAFAGSMRASRDALKTGAFSVRPRWDLTALNAS